MGSTSPRTNINPKTRIRALTSFLLLGGKKARTPLSFFFFFLLATAAERVYVIWTG